VRERTWLTTTDPEPMLQFLKDRTSDRRARLLACAAARLVWDQLPDERTRRAVEVGELYADGRAGDDALRSALDAAFEVLLDEIRADPGGARGLERWFGYHCTSDTVERMWGLARPQRTFRERLQDLPWKAMGWWLGLGKISVRCPNPQAWCGLIRCIFGNPFRPIAFDPRWQTMDVLGIAQGVYEDRAFDRLPLLADALMDAGCADEQVLGHCRSEGPHARGCHVVDLVLDKD
jgi:hypothetical protein